MVIRVLAIGDLVNNIVDLKKFVKKSKIHLINFPWNVPNEFVSYDEGIEYFNSEKTSEQLKKINSIKEHFDICIVLSPAGARIAYLADLNYIWFFVGDAIRAPLFAKNKGDNLVLKESYYNLNFIERHFYKQVYESAVTCVTWGEELFMCLKKWRHDGIRLDKIAVDTNIFNENVKPINKKKTKFTFFCPTRIGLAKGYDIIWKAIPLCKNDFEVIQVNWYDKKTPEELCNSKQLLKSKPPQVKLIPLMKREELAKYYVWADAVIGQMRIGIGGSIEREAVFCKKPVLQYADPKIKFVINGKELSQPCLPRTRDPKELAELMDRLIESEKFRNQLLEDEYNFVKQIGDPHEAAFEWDKIFEENFQKYKTIKKNSSPIKIKFRIFLFFIANRLHYEKILHKLKRTN